jgi:hypothetical protein
MEPSEISMTALETELAAYAHDGVISPLSDADAVTTTANPTLFKSKSRYDLHYASIPFFAFALHPSLLTGDRPLATHCHHELDSWVRALKARALGGGVNWTFAVGDGLRMCAALMPRHFDVRRRRFCRTAPAAASRPHGHTADDWGAPHGDPPLPDVRRARR